MKRCKIGNPFSSQGQSDIPSTADMREKQNLQVGLMTLLTTQQAELTEPLQLSTLSITLTGTKPPSLNTNKSYERFERPILDFKDLPTLTPTPQSAQADGDVELSMETQSSNSSFSGWPPQLFKKTWYFTHFKTKTVRNFN